MKKLSFVPSLFDPCFFFFFFFYSNNLLSCLLLERALGHVTSGQLQKKTAGKKWKENRTVRPIKKPSVTYQ